MISGPFNKRRKKTDTRCGCDAHIFGKLCRDNSYKIESWVEHHIHGLVSPDKRHLIRSIAELVRAQKILCTHATRQALALPRHNAPPAQRGWDSECWLHEWDSECWLHEERLAKLLP